MSAFDKFYSVRDKLDVLLEKYLLVAEWQANSYPLTLIITPDTDLDVQTAMYAMDDGGFSQDSRLVIQFPVGCIDIKVNGRISIPDEVMTRIKGYAKKMHYLWLQAYFCERNDGVVQDQPQGDQCGAAEIEKDNDDPGYFDGFFDGEDGEGEGAGE